MTFQIDIEKCKALELNGIGVDIGGTKTAISFLRNGYISKRMYYKTRFLNMEDIVNLIANSILENTKEIANGIIGISVPGIVSLEDTVIIAPNIAESKDFPISDYIYKKTGFRTVAIDDRMALVLGEALHFNTRNICAVAIGTGVGVGLIIGGVVINSVSVTAGAIGWSPSYRSILDNDYNLEQTISGPGIENQAKELIQQNEYNDECSYEEITPDFVFKEYDNGITWAKSLIENVKENVVFLLTILANMFGPNYIILNGSIGIQLGKRFENEIQSKVRQRCIPYLSSSIKILTSEIGQDAFSRGAVLWSIIPRYR